MKRFIRYLYEYEQGRRLRNVGFVKVEQGDEDCVIHIHGKGLHMKGEKRLQLYLFYEEGDGCVGIWQGTVDNVNPAINYQLYYTKEDTGVPENFRRINGVILENESGHKYAVVWDDMPVNVNNMRVWSPKEVKQGQAASEDSGNEQEELHDEAVQAEEAQAEQEEELRAEEAPEEEVQSVQEELQAEEVMPQEEPQAEEVMPQAEPQAEEAMPQEEPQAEEAMPQEESRAGRVWPNMEQEAGTRGEPAGTRPGGMGELQTDMPRDGREMPASQFQCTKIQRNELARLPRCEWKLSNNNFLLHGYYNYHHLALIDDGERLRLGVPGIYHPQEAKAAAACGFPEFIPSDDLDIGLADDEKNGQEQFGYWCRYVKRPAKPGGR